MKNINLSIRNVTEEDYSHLCNLAVLKTGRCSLSALVKTLIREQITLTPPSSKRIDNNRKRLEARVNKSTRLALDKLAKEAKMSTNQFVSMLLEQYINQSPLLSTAEIMAIYQSNQQLLAIGRNLNQIAKALNSGLATNLSTQTIQTLEKTIEQHTLKIGDMIRANYERMPKRKHYKE